MTTVSSGTGEFTFEIKYRGPLKGQKARQGSVMEVKEFLRGTEENSVSLIHWSGKAIFFYKNGREIKNIELLPRPRPGFLSNLLFLYEMLQLSKKRPFSVDSSRLVQA